MKIVSIVTDLNNKTICADVEYNGVVKFISTSWLQSNRNSITLDNAIVDCNGFVRGKDELICLR